MSEDYIRRKIHEFMRNKLGATDEFLKEVMEDYELTEDEQQKMLEFVFPEDDNGPSIDNNAVHIYKKMFQTMYTTLNKNNISKENLFTEFNNNFVHTENARLKRALDSAIFDVLFYDSLASKLADIYTSVKRNLQL